MLETSCPVRVRLDELAVLTIEGPDAPAFLHGQITNAVQDIPPGTARPAAYCSAQGRMLANLIVWRAGPDTLRVMLARDLAASVAKRLAMFVLRAKVTIRVEEALAIHGFSGASNLPPDGVQADPWGVLNHGDDHWIIAPVRPGRTPRAWLVTRREVQAAPDDGSWQAAELDEGRPWIRLVTQDMFLPTVFDMDLTGGIDFGKGCYPGQEVIARAHYRGTVKRRMACGTAAWPQGMALPAPGSDIFEYDGAQRPTGRVIDRALAGGQLHVAVEITLSDWPAMRYAVLSPEGPVLTLVPPRSATLA